MFGFGSLIGLASVVMLVVGPLTAFNCLRGLLSREGMYNQDAANQMVWGQLLGIALGLGAAWVGYSNLTGSPSGIGGCLTG